MSFTIAQLTGHRALVRGTDTFGTVGECVVSSEEWEAVKQHMAAHDAVDTFDAKVADFFAPLIEAAEAINYDLTLPTDDLDIVVFSEGVEGVEAVPAEVISLSHDSKVLRLIESGDTDRLVWVDNMLEILAVLPGTGADEVVPDPIESAEVVEG